MLATQFRVDPQNRRCARRQHVKMASSLATGTVIAMSQLLMIAIAPHEDRRSQALTFCRIGGFPRIFMLSHGAVLDGKEGRELSWMGGLR